MAKKIQPTLLELEDIPLTLQKIASLIDKEITVFTKKDSLSSEEAKNLIAYSGVLSTIYKDYRAEVLAIQKDLKSKTKEEILAMINADGRTN